LNRNRRIYQHTRQEHDSNPAEIDIHDICENQCRSSIILTYIEQCPQSLARTDKHGDLPLHILLFNESSIDIALMVIEKYSAALQHRNYIGNLPLHIECKNRCRSAIISRCIELYPEALAIADGSGCLPLHLLILNKSSSVEDALMMIEKNQATLQHQTKQGYLPLHMECYGRCRSSIILRCIEMYPEGLKVAAETGYLPLHLLVRNDLSTIDDALTMIEKYPAALQHRDIHSNLPLHIECKKQCRPSIIMRCIELYPELVDDIIDSIFDKINEHNYHRGSGYRSVVTMIVTIRPMSLYRLRASKINDIRSSPDCRRQILNLLPRHVFTPRHELDYRDLNWQPRAAMMMLLAQMQIQRHTLSSHVLEYGCNSLKSA
jgi:ankyrin repeat protein